MGSEDESRGHTEHTVYTRLRQLQAQSRANLPVTMTQRSSSTFTLHEEPVPAQAREQVLVVVYPQDPFIGEPEVRAMAAADLQNGLINSRVRVNPVDGQVAQPDDDGNYLYWPGQVAFDQVNAFYYTTFTLRTCERYARRALPWAFPSPRVTVDAASGTRANAFYSEQEQMLGFHRFEADGETMSTAHSADVVSHEAAHAVLDGLRDLYNESFGLGPSAFHESFADIMAMLVALHDDSLVRRFLDWTGGDLRVNNFVAQVAEQLTHVLNQREGRRVEAGTIYMRNALNRLTYKPFDTLTYYPDEPEVTLGRQPHNYSRLFSGAFYDILTRIYDRLRAEMPAHIAIYRARDIAGYLLMAAIEAGPVGELDFSDMARAWLSVERSLYDGHYQDVLVSVFAARGLLTQEEADAHVKAIEALPDLSLPQSINSALASALFLEEKVLPALKLKPDAELVPMSAYRNASGYAFLTYYAAERIALDGPEYGDFDGVSVDLFGGLTLVFNPDDKLCSVTYRPVQESDKREVRVLTADLIERGLITTDAINGERKLTNGMPEGIMLQATGDTASPRGQLVKYPAIMDDLPIGQMKFQEYLRCLMRPEDTV